MSLSGIMGIGLLSSQVNSSYQQIQNQQYHSGLGMQNWNPYQQNLGYQYNHMLQRQEQVRPTINFECRVEFEMHHSVKEIKWKCEQCGIDSYDLIILITNYHDPRDINYQYGRPPQELVCLLMLETDMNLLLLTYPDLCVIHRYMIRK